MQHTRAQEPIEMSLREHLLAASGSSAPPPYPSSSAGHEHPYPQAPDEHHHLDPNVAGQQMQYTMSADNGAEDMNSERKGKRELSTSKRAAQNRAAQRAFRQRKEGYIKKLEEQVKEFQSIEQNYKLLQNENYQLREYILNLQSRLLENQSDFPPAPSHINLSAGGPSQPSAIEPPGNLSPNRRQRILDIVNGRSPQAPVVARGDVARDGMSQLQAAAAQDDRHPQSSPYGLGGQYPQHQPEPRPANKESERDAKSS